MKTDIQKYRFDSIALFEDLRWQEPRRDIQTLPMSYWTSVGLGNNEDRYLSSRALHAPSSITPRQVVDALT